MFFPNSHVQLGHNTDNVGVNTAKSDILKYCNSVYENSKNSYIVGMLCFTTTPSVRWGEAPMYY